MVTKAIVLGKKVGTNKYFVRIPWLENSGGEQSVYEATVATSPCISEDYNEDDVVYVAFEDRQIEKIVIIGSLFLLDNSKSRGFANLQNLKVGGSATLPITTTIGDVSGQDIVDLVKKNYVFANIPEPPDDDGDYILVSYVDNGVKVYDWSTSVSPSMEPVTYLEALAILEG